MNDSTQISSLMRHRLVPLAARAVVGAALLGFVFSRQADLQHVVDILRGADVRILLLALIIAVTGEAITAWKWALLVRHAGGALPYGVAVWASFIGMFYNNFLPGSVGGDIVRVLLIAQYAGGKAKAAASAFMQRNTGLAGLFAVGIPAAFLSPIMIDWPGNFPGGPSVQWLHDCRLWLIAAAVGYCAINVLLFSRSAYDRVWAIFLRESDSAPSRRQYAGVGLKHSMRNAIAYFLQKLRRLHTEIHGSKFWLARPLKLSAATQIIDVLMVWTLAHALGLPMPIQALMVVVPMVTLANLLPITVNGVGLREFMYVALMSGIGVSASQAVALSLMQFGIIITLAAIGGIWHVVSPNNPPTQ